MNAATEALDRVRRTYESAVVAFQSALVCGAAVVSRRFVIGARQVQVRMVGAQLADRWPCPWQHLATEDAIGPPALTIDIWHLAETGIAPPVVDTINPADRYPYEVSTDDRIFAMRQPETTAWLERDAGHLVAVVGDVERRALYEIGRPLEMALLVWLRDQHVPLVHASFVAHRDRGALILGKSGSGKSTLAAECACAGFDFLGDDKIAFLPDPAGRFFGYSLSASLHVDARSLTRLPRLADHAIAPVHRVDDKYRVPLEQVLPGHLRVSAPICAIVLPTLAADGQPAGLTPASRKAALLALSLSTLMALPIARRNSLDAFAALAEAVPAYTFRLVGDVSPPNRLAGLLSAVAPT